MTPLEYLGLWLLLNVIILVHELGHAAAAGLVGSDTESITLGFPTLFAIPIFGIPTNVGLIPLFGLAKISNFMDSGPIRKFIIAVAGPIASFGLALLCFQIAGGSSLVQQIAANNYFIQETLSSFWNDTQNPILEFTSLYATTKVATVAVAAGCISLILAILNMLPVPILDGGRALFALLEALFGEWVSKVHTALIPISFFALIIFEIIRW